MFVIDIHLMLMIRLHITVSSVCHKHLKLIVRICHRFISVLHFFCTTVIFVGSVVSQKHPLDDSSWSLASIIKMPMAKHCKYNEESS